MSKFIENSLGDYVSSEDLRVYRSLDPALNARTSDFTILGFKKISPRYDRGRKVEATYLCASSDDLIVKKTFTDVRNESGRLTDLQIKFDFYNEGNEIGLSYTEVVKSFNEWEAQTEERKRREKQRDFLIAEGVRANASTFIDTLFSYFEKEIQAYIQTGSKTWEAKIRTHAPVSNDPMQLENQIYGILEAKPENNFTIRQAILYQISGSLV